MKENKHIKGFAKALFLRKSLYFSILFVFLATIIILLIVGYNSIYLPDLKVIRLLSVVAGLLLLLAAILFPIRYFLLAGLTPWLSDHKLGYLLSKYDKGLLTQANQLKKEGDIGTWSSKKVKRNSELLLTKTLPSLKKRFNIKKVIALLFGLACIAYLLPRTSVMESSKELLFGGLRSSFNDSIIKDTVHVHYKERYNIAPILSQGFLSTGVNGAFVIEKDTVLYWEYLHRRVREQYIICDSIPLLTSWSAEITPPQYLNLTRYNVNDTITAYEGSLVKLRVKGVLTEWFKIKVSRGTHKIQETFVVDHLDTAVFIYHKTTALQIPIHIIKDIPPVIDVLENELGFVRYSLKDDFMIKGLRLNKEDPTTVNRSEVEIEIKWRNMVKMEVTAWDSFNQLTTLEIKKPNPLASELLSNTESSIPSKAEQLLGLKKTKPNTFKRSTMQELQKEEKKQNDLTDVKKIERPNETKEDLLNELDVLWKTEQLIGLLETVDTGQDRSLDTAMFEVSKSILETTEQNNIKEAAGAVLKISETGEERAEKAKEAAEKLKDILNEEMASVRSDNVERLKRLLKGSWSVSVQQERMSVDPQEQSAKQQRALLALEQVISDTVDVIMVSDRALNQVLAANREDLDNALFSFKDELNSYQQSMSTMGYVVNALNQLSETLYFILESEKKALANANNKCKKGKPGTVGKPSKSGQGKEGKQGNGQQGQLPNGRKKGKTRTPSENKEGEQGFKPGSTGAGGSTKELLKILDNAKNKLSNNASSKALEEAIKKLKEELLFNTSVLSKDNKGFNDRLWETLEAVYNKNQTGNQRDANEPKQDVFIGGEEQLFEVREYQRSALPLPILKQNK